MYSIAIIGAGRIGAVHARNAYLHPGLDLRYIVDFQPTSAEDLATEFGTQAGTLDQVLADPQLDAVLIASPTSTHAEYIIKCAEAGKHIFCEKPIDLDLATSEACLQAVMQHEAKFLLGFNRRYDPDFARLKQTIEDGQIGELEMLQITSHDPAPPPVSYINQSGGLFKDMTIHDFDMARWLLGEPVSEIYAAGSCLVDPAIGDAGDIDSAKITLKTASGKLCSISNSRRAVYGYDQRIEAFGSKGLVKADNILCSHVAVWGDQGATKDRVQDFFIERYDAAYRIELDHFVNLLAGNCLPQTTIEDGVEALRLAEAAARSMQEGRAVTP
ncbi:inositol 2-dehydrogenase [Paremcibacter congregatus]|uniref:Inositol 2-dehydrogenase n=1 Tax=Paremcibacter congregatus TaxID=2043170 RepID=A0A2G4YWH2_9PROT|nr:inositol 2-dehydrogenase [Paremcibacter congregatus]PHZ86688.1 inositol 2-dehydrogenase [Paremcibacter congregatus]QDE26339.1 inositol 2-dehydrogenase [Paremcibacter congregatus]